MYGRNVAPEPAEYPSAQVSGITSACQASPEQDTANLEAFLKVAYYSEIKPTLVQLLEHYRGRLLYQASRLELRSVLNTTLS